MEKLKFFIIITIIIIILIIIGILVVYKIDKQKKEDIINQGDAGDTIIYDTKKVEQVTDKNRFFIVKSCVQEYLDELNNNNSKYFGYNDNNEYSKIVDEKTINENRYNLLSYNYIDNNKITIENINNYIETLNQKVIFDVLKMNYIKGDRIENYIVYGVITSLDNKFLKEIYIIVNLDRQNQTFSIEPLDSSKYSTIDDVNIEYMDNSIEEKENNKYSNKQITYEDMAEEYFYMLKRLLKSKSEIIYNYLDEEYRTLKYGNLDNFVKYINNNIKYISELQIKKYLTNNYSDYTEYVCMDQYENQYVFKEYAPMNINIKLDTYTILSDEFKEKYDSSKEQYKVAMNIERWIKMLNTRDYSNAYKVLDETFRNNNWGSEEEFEKYMKEKLPLHYNIEYTTNSSENTTYIQQIKLSDITEKNEEVITMNIIMQLKDNYEFVMSFNIE